MLHPNLLQQVKLSMLSEYFKFGFLFQIDFVLDKNIIKQMNGRFLLIIRDISSDDFEMK